jgi:hypothetical protein
MLRDDRVPAAQIAVAALVTAQPGEVETRRLYDAIPSPKVLAECDPDAGEWGHCKGVASAATTRSSTTGSTGSWRAEPPERSSFRPADLTLCACRADPPPCPPTGSRPSRMASKASPGRGATLPAVGIVPCPLHAARWGRRHSTGGRS